MEAWQIGLVVFALVGAAALWLAYRRDTVTARRRREVMHNPPERDIPALNGQETSPTYLSDEDSQRTPRGAPSTELSVERRSDLQASLSDAVKFAGGYATRDFITDSVTGWAVCDHPRVLLVSDGIHSMRELLPVIALLDGDPLVLVAPRIGDDVVDTLRANQTQRTLAVCPVLFEGDLGPVAEAVNGLCLNSAKLQAGYVPAEALGRAETWVSDGSRSWVVT